MGHREIFWENSYCTPKRSLRRGFDATDVGHTLGPAFDRDRAPPAQELAIVRPDHPLQPSYGDLQMLYQFYGEHIRHGQVTTLADDLTNDSGCGKWTPAAPGDVSGPTIAEVVRGTK
jgi:hypothetical protein